MCVYIYIYTHTYIYIYTHTHTYIYTCTLKEVLSKPENEPKGSTGQRRIIQKPRISRSTKPLSPETELKAKPSKTLLQGKVRILFFLLTP